MSDCRNNTSVPGCYDNAGTKTNVVIHYTFDNAGQPAVRITDTAGVVIAAATAANTVPGSCAAAASDVEWEQLCDIAANGSATTFFRRSITSFDAAGVPTTVTADFQLDKTTAYVPAGTVGACPSCAQLAARGVQATW